MVVVVANGKTLHLRHGRFGERVVGVEERGRLQTREIGDQETLVSTIVGGLEVSGEEKRD